MLPEEAYLRELVDLELGSADEILAFANAWGWIGDPQFSIEDEDVDPRAYGDDNFVAPRLEGRFHALVGTGDLRPQLGFAIAEELRAAMHEWSGLLAGELRHLDEFVLYASVLRDLTRVSEALGGRRPWSEVVGLWETPRAWLAPYDSGEAIEDRVEFFCRVLNGALARFAPRFTLHRNGPANLVALPDWHANTFEALALQLANHFAEASDYKVCANTRCGRYFVHQRGTARHGQNRSDAKYCSGECARAQAQREYRRRKKRVES